MGYGDDIMATGMARGAKARGVQIAFGDGKRIIWGPHSEEIFRNNPNIARPGSERSKSIEWIAYHKGHRIYNTLGQNQWVWNYNFKPKPGEIFFDEGEKRYPRPSAGYVLIEPNVPVKKSCAPNKQWPVNRYQSVASHFRQNGLEVLQFDTGSNRLEGVSIVKCNTFREAMIVMTYARIAILPEGGLHHAAAALGIPSVVIFGGFIPPEVTGYDDHINLVGSSKACGSLRPCPHCRKALDNISVDDVLMASEKLLCH